MRTQKAVILAAGIGSRMRRSETDRADLREDAAHMAQKGLKGLIPIRGRPFLDYAVGDLLAAGLRRICLVVPPESKLLTDYARRTSRLTGAEITWAVQAQPQGTADALLAAEEFTGRDGFVMSNCDTLYPADAVARLSQVSDRCCYVAAFDRDRLLEGSNFGPERLSRFAVLVVAEEGILRDIVEKPAAPDRYVRDGKLWVNLNLFRFTPDVFDACRQIKPHPGRGELELADAVSLLASRPGEPFRVVFAGGAVVDLTGREDVASAERLLRGRSPGF